MKLTNRYNLPQPVVDAVRNDGYSSGDAHISVTTLINPPRIAVLKERFADQITEDVSDRIWSLFGQAIHTILERANTSGIAERRLSVEVEGWRISGGMDAYYPGEGKLQDYKTTTVYKILGDGIPTEWECQLNCYAHLLRSNGDAVRRLEVVAVLRDWSKMTARRKADYPQAQVVNVPIPLWEPERAEKYMRERVILHKQARVTLPECTPEDRWAKPDQWAVMVKGGKKALKLYTSEAAAKDHASFVPGLIVQPRPSESVRCWSYCSAASFCDQFKQSTRTETQSAEAAVVGLNHGETGT